MCADTIAAIATPPGPGGVAVVRVSGALTKDIVRRLTSLPTFDPNTIRPCRFYSADRSAVLERGLLAAFLAPHSYTGEDSAEFHCHGSYYLARQILEQILQSGARLAQPGEFTKRAFLAGKLELTQVEAVADMLNAGSALQLRLAMRHLEGDVAKAIKSLRREILQTLAGLEAALDYPEELSGPTTGQILELLAAVRTKIDRLLTDSSAGLRIKAGVSIVLAGKTNAGKSSLFNALLRQDRAIVADLPGTTRDALEAAASFGGLQVNLIDTAGLRESTDRLEQLGMERSREQLRSADLILFVLDGATGYTEADRQTLELFQGLPYLTILNKADLPHEDYPGALEISAKDGLGLVTGAVLSASIVTVPNAEEPSTVAYST